MRKLLLTLFILVVITITGAFSITLLEEGRVYRDIETIPYREVGLLLGTSPGSDGMQNLFYTTRIEATKMLYERGKIHHILVSGDNGTRSYNEPELMKKSLMKAGIPESAITLDYAGFRTLDSVIRAREIFGQTDGFTIISQPFHVERALFLARANGIDAIGYGAANVSISIAPLVYIREIGARWLAIYDAIFGTDPIVLGEKEELKR